MGNCCDIRNREVIIKNDITLSSDVTADTKQEEEEEYQKKRISKESTISGCSRKYSAKKHEKPILKMLRERSSSKKCNVSNL